jgi:DivIVA domain-containing protein
VLRWRYDGGEHRVPSTTRSPNEEPSMSWLTRLFTGEPAPMLSAGALPAPGRSVPAAAAAGDAGALSAGELRATTLPRTKWREGYDIAQVDLFLARSAAALDVRARGGRADLTADDVVGAKFQATKLHEGYDQDAVDDLLDKVVAALR